MENEVSSELGNKSENKSAALVGTAVLLTAVIAGAGVYFWQQSNVDKVKEGSQKQMVAFQNQIDILQKEKRSLQTSDSSDKITFPLVVYSPAGLLNNTENGKNEKKNLEEKLINPFIDYHNE